MPGRSDPVPERPAVPPTGGPFLRAPSALTNPSDLRSIDGAVGNLSGRYRSTAAPNRAAGHVRLARAGRTTASHGDQRRHGQRDQDGTHHAPALGSTIVNPAIERG
ncbi:hypothetical protein Nwi_1536 [Nitrobacter winogradskyi Nb-255]|uniref:Uncharacterized protein n=1 Tax=Nitrobacter winogradskyi (strain ATCC 25391 / DSM 10237 / CIP 104748 / NCIMB 11846 / Nb-255) TaxID=323098 RepID=Q3SSE4_NITWN|nr:hypothetical protein Nwi_1536 [Nitrobacter winogradskyi Nb-255]